MFAVRWSLRFYVGLQVIVEHCFNIWVWFVCRCVRSGLGGLPALQQESLCLCSVCVYHTYAEHSQDLPTWQRYQPFICSLFVFFYLYFFFFFFFVNSCFFSLELLNLCMVSSLNCSPCFTFSPIAVGFLNGQISY